MAGQLQQSRGPGFPVGVSAGSRCLIVNFSTAGCILQEATVEQLKGLGNAYHSEAINSGRGICWGVSS